MTTPSAPAPAQRPATPPRRLLVLVAAVALALAGACSPSTAADDAAPPGERPGASGATTPANSPLPAEASTAPPPEQYSGPVDGFYEVPDPLPRGKPGELIRVQVVGESAGARTLRVMYHSRDARNHDRAVTGIITHPLGAAPEGGWPVVSWAHGTTGLASPCAPSRAGGAAPGFGIEGVHVATDYIGLGPVGERHPYLSGESEAHSVVDAVRAARHLPDAHAGARWVAVGHSQGGHSALFTNELGPGYAKELDLLGTVAVAPAAVLTRTFGPTDVVIPRMVGVMALYGLAADHPQVDPEDYVGDEVAAVDDVIDTGCLDDVVAAMVGIPADVFYDVDPLHTQPARSVLLRNDPGQVRSPSPLLVVYGTLDSFVVPARAEALVDQLCAIDQVTAVVEVEGADHGTVVPRAGAPITEWLAGRLAGEPAPDDCP